MNTEMMLLLFFSPFLHLIIKKHHEKHEVMRVPKLKLNFFVMQPHLRSSHSSPKNVTQLSKKILFIVLIFSTLLGNTWTWFIQAVWSCVVQQFRVWLMGNRKRMSGYWTNFSYPKIWWLSISCIVTKAKYLYWFVSDCTNKHKRRGGKWK